jgi:hypothetical protein
MYQYHYPSNHVVPSRCYALNCSSTRHTSLPGAAVRMPAKVAHLPHQCGLEHPTTVPGYRATPVKRNGFIAWHLRGRIWLTLFATSADSGTGLLLTAPLEGPHIHPKRYTLWNNNWQRKTEFRRHNRAIQPLYLPQIPYGLHWHGSETSVVRRRRLTATAMVQCS